MDLRLIVVADDGSWYESVMHFYVGEEEEGPEDHLRNGRRQLMFVMFAITSILGTTLFVGISAWPAAMVHTPGYKSHFH